MPDVTVAANKVAAHDITLVAGQVSSVTFTDNISRVEIVSDGSAKVFYTVDGSTPTVGGAGCYPIPAVGPLISDERNTTPWQTAGNLVDVVRLISAGTPTVSVVRAD